MIYLSLNTGILIKLQNITKKIKMTNEKIDKLKRQMKI